MTGNKDFVTPNHARSPYYTVQIYMGGGLNGSLSIKWECYILSGGRGGGRKHFNKNVFNK